MSAQFKELIAATGLSQSKAADLISMRSNKVCSERDIRAWMALPGLKTSRPCPEWAIAALSHLAPAVRAAA